MSHWTTALAVCGLLTLTGTAQAGYRGPFEGRVVDADTRKPIQGAVVFMEWTYVKIGEEMETLYDTAEVLTDEQGHFRIKKKWSLNPWTNFRVEARAMIYKAGYGAGVNLGTPWLRSLAEAQSARSPEERKRIGPHFYLDIEFDGDLPVFVLKRLATEEERLGNIPHPSETVSEQDMKLLQAEQLRERKALGRDD